MVQWSSGLVVLWSYGPAAGSSLDFGIRNLLPVRAWHLPERDQFQIPLTFWIEISAVRFRLRSWRANSASNAATLEAVDDWHDL